MKAAISGSSGFIGSHLSKKLISLGYEVVPISQDLLYDSIELRNFFEYHHPELIFHFATYGNLHKHSHPSRVVRANIMGTFNMLRESSNVNYKAFVNVGSSSEYGKKSTPMKESDTLRPETFYAATKASATHLAAAFAYQYKKPIVTIRPFSVFGPREPEEHFIPVLINNLLQGKLTGVDLESRHDWIYIDDLIEGILCAVDNISNIPDGVVNIGTGVELTNKQIVDTLEKISGKTPLVAAVNNLRPNDSEHWVADPTLLQSFGWETQKPIEEGFKRTYQYYKDLYDKQKS